MLILVLADIAAVSIMVCMEYFRQRDWSRRLREVERCYRLVQDQIDFLRAVNGNVHRWQSRMETMLVQHSDQINECARDFGVRGTFKKFSFDINSLIRRVERLEHTDPARELGRKVIELDRQQQEPETKVVRAMEGGEGQ